MIRKIIGWGRRDNLFGWCGLLLSYGLSFQVFRFYGYGRNGLSVGFDDCSDTLDDDALAGCQS